tara:strand:+ start:94 stop:534 length:441 start_codon:yes stop_codon:yes gene_type:complete
MTTTTIDELNASLPRIAKKWKRGSKVHTLFGPEFYNCFGSTRPTLHAFTTIANGSVFLVGLYGRFADFADLRWKFMKVAEPMNGPTRKVRTLDFDGVKFRVYYSRKAALAQMARLTDARLAENARLAREHRAAVAAGDHATAAEYA